MNETLIKTIINRLKNEYSSLESQEEKVNFGLQYAGHYKLNEFIAYMEDIPLYPENSLSEKIDQDSHIYKLFHDKEYQMEHIKQLRERYNDNTLYEEYNEYLNS